MSQTEKLSLYYYTTCPFCVRVRMAAKDIDVDLELRDITASEEHLRDLVDATGRQTVPVLRIDGPGGEVRWMPESAEIIRYLQDHYA